MIQTHSKFFYEFRVTTDTKFLDFDEGSGVLTAEIRPGSYSPTRGLNLVAEAMSDAGTQAYTVTINRTTRLVTISAAAPFDLLIQTGPTEASSIFETLGFSGADQTGLSSYTGSVGVVKEYVPQFKLQDWIDPDHFQRSVDDTVKTTASGEVEAVVFGRERLIQANIRYATDLPMDGKVIRNNPDGVSALVDFLSHGISKSAFEIMPDELTPNQFYTVILERTPDSPNGTDFRLRELYDQNLPSFYETGILQMRIVE